MVGFFYDALSDCGHSIFRPLIFLVIFGIYSRAAYKIEHDYLTFEIGKSGCLDESEGSPFRALYIVSVSNIAPLITLNSIHKKLVERSYRCLIGVSAVKIDGSFSSNISSWVYFFMTFQGLSSVVLFFLFFLAVRNHFKIR